MRKTCSNLASAISRHLLHGLLALLCSASAGAAEPDLRKITLPPGFSIALWAQVDNARQMTLGQHDSNGGTVFVGSMRSGKVHAVRFSRELQVEHIATIASKLPLPVGVAYRQGDLYVSAVDRILRFGKIDRHLDAPPQPTPITQHLPTEKHHGWKFIAFGPDDKLYVPVGAPCNICRPDPERYANILRMNPDGSAPEVFARGVRNSVGFDWHPLSGHLWFTDNGRDLLGDDTPPDELNHAPRPGMHFGYPYCHGTDVADPEFGKERDCAEFAPPARELGAHVAALGMRFYTGKMFPAQYRNQIFIAEHGSWNRSKKTGYRVTLVRLQGNKAVSYEVFASGWLDKEKPWGRPTDVLVLPDGSLLVADDLAGAIYRIAYHQPGRHNKKE